MNQTPYITLAQAARLCPGRPHPSTVWRWSSRGVNGVKLRTGRQGRRVVTTRAWLREFTEASVGPEPVRARRVVEASPDAESLCAKEGI